MLPGEDLVRAVEDLSAAGAHRGDLPEVPVVDVVRAARQAAEARSLPPREDGPAAIRLRPEVRGRLAGRHGVEPDDATSVVDDLRAIGVLVRSTCRCDE